MVSLVVLPLLLLLFRQTSGTDVLVLPLGVTREFVCTSPPEPGYAIAWGVNGAAATSPQFQDYIALGGVVHSENGGTQKNLTFTADARANNTYIRCAVTNIHNGEFIIPIDMNLILQGQLPPPTVTYEVSSDHHSVMFSWSAPFTFNISDMEPDILHYLVHIIRNDGHNETVNTTDTHYELQADPCQSHQYYVGIAAVNVVGEGEKYRSHISLEGYAVVLVLSSTVSLSNMMVVIQINTEVFPHCHDLEVVKYEVELNATYSHDRLLFRSSGNGSAGQQTVTLRSPDIKMNELYGYSVGIEGLSNSESLIMNLSTFDVQHVDTNNHHEQLCGYTDITCYFARESDAKGCRIVIQTLQGATSCEFVASREEEEKAKITVALPNGAYTLLVYDKENGAVHNPAFTTILSVLCGTQVSECATVPSDFKSQPAPLNNALLSVTAAGGLLLFIVTSFMCLTVSAILIRRKKRRAAIVLAPNIAYEEVKLKQKKRRTAPSHGQPVVALNQDQ